jgi:putative PIN family toxin of toxin-antitoxin system
MIVVLDTNVIISALLSPSGPPATIIDHWRAEDLDVVTSPPLLDELERVLHYPRVLKRLRWTSAEIEEFIQDFQAVATVVEPQMTLNVIKQNPPDNRVLECAVAGAAAYIVSGNADLLDPKTYSGIVILNPAAFLRLLRQSLR